MVDNPGNPLYFMGKSLVSGEDFPTKVPLPQDAAEALALQEAQQEAERAATARAQQAAEAQ